MLEQVIQSEYSRNLGMNPRVLSGAEGGGVEEGVPVE